MKLNLFSILFSRMSIIIGLIICILNIIAIPYYRKIVFKSAKCMMNDIDEKHFYSECNSYVIAFLFVYTLIAMALCLLSKHLLVAICAIIYITNFVLLGTNILSNYLALNYIYKNGYTEVSLSDFISNSLSLQSYFSTKIHKNQFINNDGKYFKTKIDGKMIKDPNAIKKLAIINEELIPKYYKAAALLNEIVSKAKVQDDLYKENCNKLLSDEERIINKINKLCDEIIEIETSNDLDDVYKEVDKFSKLC